jgi:hypothetical protein
MGIGKLKKLKKNPNKQQEWKILPKFWLCQKLDTTTLPLKIARKWKF